MKIKLSQMHIMVLIIAAVFIVYGAVQAIFGLQENKPLLYGVAIGLALIAAVYFRIKKKGKSKDNQ